jgi:hypothetical protein
MVSKFMVQFTDMAEITTCSSWLIHHRDQCLNVHGFNINVHGYNVND